jgi:EmrB/QacA subfamily drug resistance transporter
MSSIDDLFARHGPAYRWLATATAMISAAAVVLSTTIVNVAIPGVMGAFGIGQIEAQWISTAFLAAMTATMLLADWVDRAFGLRAGMSGALILFATGSVLGALAPNEIALTLARVVQGAATGVVQPLAMVLMFRVYPPDQRGMAMGIFGVGVVLAPAIGPWVGGLLVDAFDWRYVFYLGVPFALLGLGLSHAFLPTRAGQGPRPRFDWIGFLLLCAFLGAALVALTDAQRRGWTSAPILLLFGAALISGTGFILWERRVTQPILDLRLFAVLPFAAASVVSAILGAGLFGSIYLLPLFVQTIQGLSASEAGLMLMPAGLVLCLLFPLMGRVADHVPPGLPIGAGLAIFALSTWLTAGIDIGSSFWILAWLTALSRIGLGMIFPPLTAGSLRVLPRELVAQGSGAINFVRQLGGAFGVNLLAIFLERRTAHHADALAATQGHDNAATAEYLGRVAQMLRAAGLPDMQQIPAAIAFLGEAILAQASTLAFRDGFLAVTATFLAALVPNWILHRATTGQALRR